MACVVSLGACDKGGKSKTPEGKGVNVKVPPPIYGADAHVPKEVMDRCKFDSKLADAVVDSTPGASISTGGDSGKFLNMEIVSMRGVDPDSQGERIVIVRGELLNEGATEGSFRARYTAQGGLVAGVGGVCASLGDISDLMGIGIAEFIRNPSSGAQLAN